MQHHHFTPGEWEALANDPEFVALLRARRRFIIPLTIFFLLFYLALPAGIALAPGVMNRAVFESLSVANLFGFAQIIVAWGLLALYMREARSFDKRAQALVERAAAEFAK
ncbi:MAG TPA: DUF485 domain-containing protein [Candidatus Acidoferrales bacterium]|nr:DUF485 domain-containing protein [Candidatus Acidoferrales bacterium]